MAGEDAFADYVGLVLPRLVDVGSTGAILWCFADYDPSMYGEFTFTDAGKRSS